MRLLRVFAVFPAFLAIAGGCADDSLSGASGRLDGPALIDFGRVPVGTPKAMLLKLRALEGAVVLEAVEPVEDLSVGQLFPQTLGAGEVGELPMLWRPSALGPWVAHLRIRSSSGQTPVFEIELSGEGIAGQDCVSLNPCLDSVFDPAAGECVDVPLDGSCDDGNACTVGDTCGEGQCTGVYDDTISGCENVACPPSGRPGAPIAGRWFEEAWTSAAGDAWVVGTEGVASRFDGAEWHLIDTCSTATLFSIFGFASNDVWAVGDAGTVLHFDGFSFTAVDVGTTKRLWSVWGTSSDDLWVVGDAGTVLHRTGSGWQSLTAPSGARLYSVWGDGTRIFAAGAGGTIETLEAGSFSSWTSSTGQPLFSIRGVSPSLAWAVGAQGLILRFDGSTWSEMASPSDESLYSVWGLGASEIWAGGAAGELFRYNGSTWTDYSQADAGNVYALWGQASDNVVVATSGGRLWLWNGTTLVAQ